MSNIHIKRGWAEVVNSINRFYVYYKRIQFRSSFTSVYMIIFGCDADPAEYEPQMMLYILPNISRLIFIY